MPKPGPSPTYIFEARFRPESQIYRVSEDMRNCELLVEEQIKYWWQSKVIMTK